MREEQWIPLGLVTVPRPCKRGVIGLVDAGQEFNRQEGSLQMFTDSASIEHYVNQVQIGSNTISVHYFIRPVSCPRLI